MTNDFFNDEFERKMAAHMPLVASSIIGTIGGVLALDLVPESVNAYKEIGGIGCLVAGAVLIVRWALNRIEAERAISIALASAARDDAKEHTAAMVMLVTNSQRAMAENTVATQRLTLAIEQVRPTVCRHPG
jgi:hypothetical protein